MLDIDLLTNGNIAIVGASVGAGHSNSYVILEFERPLLTARIASFVRESTPRKSLTDTHAERFRNGSDPNCEGRHEIANESGCAHNQRYLKRTRLERRNLHDKPVRSCSSTKTSSNRVCRGVLGSRQNDWFPTLGGAGRFGVPGAGGTRLNATASIRCERRR